MSPCIDPEGRDKQEEVEIETKETAKEATTMEQQASVGAKAPDFETNALIDGDFKQVSLSDYAGQWVVLCFFPADFTFVWPTELSAVADKYDQLQDLDVEVLAVSTDKVFTHKVWEEQELSKMVDGGIPYPMLADPTAKIGKKYGVHDPQSGVHLRGRFILDPDQVIQAKEVLTDPVGRNVSELIRQVKAFQLNRETGEATPSGWVPGKKTLNPNPDLVGKVWKEWNPKDNYDE